MNSICIFDLDGTLDLTDPKLSAEILKLSRNGVGFVTATGRTNSYIQDTYKKYSIIPPRFIIADNGGTIYDNSEKRYIKRRTLPVETRNKTIEEYIRLGGLPENIRFTDGDYVYASEEEEVKKYYKEESSIKYKKTEELISDIQKEDSEITKITLAGQKGLMKELASHIEKRKIKCWTDIGATKFPYKAKQNYRLDITDGEACKGEAVEFLVNYLGVKEFTCVGNGPNDFTMFKYALDSNMPVVVVKNSDGSEITKESKDLINEVEEYAKSIGKLDKVTVEKFPINGYMSRLEDKKAAKERRKQFANSIKFEATKSKADYKIAANYQKQNRTKSRSEK